MASERELSPRAKTLSRSGRRPVHDLMVCNPPFHTGATVHAGVALRMLADARRVLKPGGEL